MSGTQAPRTVMMVRPDYFSFNPETAASNAFQQEPGRDNSEMIRAQAFSEFNDLVITLRASGVEVIEFEPAHSVKTPDAVFPNNWVSFHPDGKVILYPMMAHSRRLERRLEYITTLEKQYRFEVNEIIDLSYYEQQGLFLEGTGSLVMDYTSRVIYSNHSPRTSEVMVNKVAKILGFSVCLFRAKDSSDRDIYHTNVLMCVGEGFAIICLDAITNSDERNKVASSLLVSGHEIINISLQQMSQFAGNMMELRNDQDKSILVMSESAYRSLDQQQIQALGKYSELIYSPVHTIEKYGGGSVRCMLAEVLLPRQLTINN